MLHELSQVQRFAVGQFSKHLDSTELCQSVERLGQPFAFFDDVTGRRALRVGRQPRIAQQRRVLADAVQTAFELMRHPVNVLLQALFRFQRLTQSVDDLGKVADVRIA